MNDENTPHNIENDGFTEDGDFKNLIIRLMKHLKLYHNLQIQNLTL